jgi:hypothetical protein
VVRGLRKIRCRLELLRHRLNAICEVEDLSYAPSIYEGYELTAKNLIKKT